jgi:hypothetical protein
MLYSATNASNRWKEALSEVTRNVENAVNVLYPQLPEPRLPPTVTTSEVVGKYYDDGYKTLALEEAPHPTKEGETILVAPRDNMTWRSRIEIHHVSGDYWIAWVIPTGVEATWSRDYQRAEFKRAPDGKVNALEIRMENHLGYVYEGLVKFNRVS